MAALNAAAFWPITPGPNSGVASVPNSTAPSVRFSLPCVSIRSSVARMRRLLGSLNVIEPESSMIASRLFLGVQAAPARGAAVPAPRQAAAKATIHVFLMHASSASRRPG